MMNRLVSITTSIIFGILFSIYLYIIISEPEKLLPKFMRKNDKKNERNTY